MRYLYCSFLGAAGGIGSAICRKFASEGASVVLVDVNEEGLNEVYEFLTEEYGDKHLQVCGSVADPNFAQEVFTKISVSFGVDVIKFVITLISSRT